MRNSRVFVLVVLLVLVVPLAAVSQSQDSSNENQQFTKLDDQEILEGLLRANFLTLDCEIPYIRPYLCELSSTPRTSEEKLVEVFFGDEQGVTGEEGLRNALWGAGTRYKSGQTIVIGPRNMPIQQAISMYGEEVEMVPAYLDIFMNGFAYRNNVPHKPVYASAHLPKTLYNDPTVKFEFVYPPAEGLTAAESLIDEMFGEITVPDGFQSSVESFVMQSGERLYYYKANPQYKTHFKIYESEITNGQFNQIAVGESEVAIPVFDRFVTVILDGDKVLAGFDYFWDNDIKPIGQPQECVAASEAYLLAGDSIFEYYAEQPPLITVREIKLAYIQNRRKPNILIPVWMFDAAYARTATPQEMVSNEVIKYAENRILVPIPFAVNALTSEPFLL